MDLGEWVSLHRKRDSGSSFAEKHMSDASRRNPLSRPAMSTEEDIKEWASDMDRAALDRRFSRERKAIVDEIRDNQGMGSHITFNGSTKFVNWMLSVTTALMIASIVGGVVLYGQVQSINTKVDLLIAGHIK